MHDPAPNLRASLDAERKIVVVFAKSLVVFAVPLSVAVRCARCTAAACTRVRIQLASDTGRVLRPTAPVAREPDHTHANARPRPGTAVHVTTGSIDTISSL